MPIRWWPAATAALAVSCPLALAALTAAGASRPASEPPPFSPAVRAGQLVYFSGMLPTGEDGRVVAGDVAVQTRRALDNVSALAARHGTSLARAAAVTVYLRRAQDFAAMNAAYQTYWPADPPARTTVIGDLVVPEALVEIAVVAAASDAPRVVVHPDGWAKAANPYSYGIRVGDTLFTSGLLSRRGSDGGVIPGNVAAQTTAVLDNARAVLAAGGMRPADVVSARVYLTDTAGFAAMNGAYRAFFASAPPTRATVQVGLTAPPFLVEIALVAVAGQDRQIVTPPNADGSPGGTNPNLSAAIRVGDRLFLSGMLGASPETRGDAAAQTRGALDRLGRTLTAAGFDWQDVVESTVWLPDLAAFDAMNRQYRTVFASPFPARTTMRAGLMGPDALVEIAMLAARRR